MESLSNRFRGRFPHNYSGGTLKKDTIMPKDFLPKKDAALGPWLANFLLVANANLTALGLVIGDITPITSGTTAFNTAYGGVEGAKAALSSAVSGKDTSRKAITTSVRALVRKIQGNANVTPQLKSALGINPRTTHSVLVSPVTPSELMVEGYSNGVNSLNWKSGGNHPGTVYLVEAAYGASTNFVGVTGVTATRFDHEGQVPGAKVTYRIRARRRKQISAPTQTVTLYGDPPVTATPTLEMLKAA